MLRELQSRSAVHAHEFDYLRLHSCTVFVKFPVISYLCQGDVITGSAPL